MRFRMSNATEAGDPGFHQPGPPNAPNAAAINPTTGAYTWIPGATLHAGTEYLLLDADHDREPERRGGVIAKTPVDSSSG